jgi:hypothetical protein
VALGFPGRAHLLALGASSSSKVASVCSVLRGQVLGMPAIPHLGRRTSAPGAHSSDRAGDIPGVSVMDGRWNKEKEGCGF